MQNVLDHFLFWAIIRKQWFYIHWLYFVIQDQETEIPVAVDLDIIPDEAAEEEAARLAAEAAERQQQAVILPCSHQCIIHVGIYSTQVINFSFVINIH